MSFDKCPQCGYKEGALPQKPVTNVMNLYVNEKGDKQVVSSAVDSFKVGDVVWALEAKAKQVFAAQPKIAAPVSAPTTPAS